MLEAGPPLIYNYKEAPPGLRHERSMRPSVGYAQEKLNIFLHDLDHTLLARGNTRFPGDVARAKAFRSQMAPAFLNVDCWFGDETELATRSFQTALDLNPDGRIGPLTWRALIWAHAGLDVLGVPPGEAGAPVHFPYPGNALGLPGVSVLGAPASSHGLPPPILDAGVDILHMPNAIQPVAIGIPGRPPAPTTDPTKYMWPAPASDMLAEGWVDFDVAHACSYSGKLDWVQIVYGGDDWKSWYTRTGLDRNVLDVGRLEAPHLPRSEGLATAVFAPVCQVVPGPSHLTMPFTDRPAGAGISVQSGGPDHTGFASVGYSETFDLVLVWRPDKKPYSIPLAYATWGLGYCVTFDMPPGGKINPAMEVFSRSGSKLHGPPGFTRSIPNSLAKPSPTTVAARAVSTAVIRTHVGGPGRAQLCQM